MKSMATSTLRSVPRIVLALLRQRCPVCLRGRVYSRWATMSERCPVCNVKFEREPGYFMGAMYISYGMSIFLIVLLTLAVHLVLPELALNWAVLIASGMYVPMVPITWRYSRILWMYFDSWTAAP
jgi:uncharacterized protein (DUF983 family)